MEDLFHTRSAADSQSHGQQLMIRVATKEDRARLNRLLAKRHYLGSTPPVGDFLVQIVSRGRKWVALLVWGAAALRLRDRDQWIGWTSLQRSQRLKLVIQNRRYLLLHKKGCEPNLASQILALGCRHVPGQWEQAFGYRPLLAETFTDPQAFEGTCYKASGWIPLGLSAGNQRHYPDYYQTNDHPKKLWVKELSTQARLKASQAILSPSQRAGEVSPPNGVMPLKASLRQSLFEALLHAPDPRAKNNRFRIGSVLSIAAMALLSGARQISEIARFAQRLHPRQRSQLGLPRKKGTNAFYQVPSYSVFYQVLTRLDPEGFARILNQWLNEHQDQLPRALALEGKMIRDIVGTVSLVQHEDGAPVALAVMDQKEGTKRCELQAAKTLLAQVPNLENQTLTTDPLHCQRDHARAIVEKGGDYLFQIKGNQGNLYKLAQQEVLASPPLPKPQQATGESNRDALP